MRSLNQGTRPSRWDASFVRTHAGKPYSCDFTLWLGEPKDKYAAGQKLEIVPATGTCKRADVVRRLN